VRQKRGRENVAAELVKLQTEVAVSRLCLFLLTFSRATFSLSTPAFEIGGVLYLSNVLPVLTIRERGMIHQYVSPNPLKPSTWPTAATQSAMKAPITAL
jgi:hypothetical protein